MDGALAFEVTPATVVESKYDLYSSKRTPAMTDQASFSHRRSVRKTATSVAEAFEVTIVVAVALVPATLAGVGSTTL